MTVIKGLFVFLILGLFAIAGVIFVGIAAHVLYWAIIAGWNDI